MPERWGFLHSRFYSLLAASAIVLMVGVIDFAAGRDWHITPLYLMPLAIAVWGAGWRWGLLFSVLAAGIWLVAELSLGVRYADPWVPYWNALFLFSIVFLSVVLIVSALQSLVRRRTEQLREEMTKRHEAELARLRAERLAMVGAMAAQMAHEVRNPMCSISLNTELLAVEIRTLAGNRSHSPEEAVVLLDQIGRETLRIENVMRDYLGFARLPKVAPRPHSLHEFLEEKLALTRAELAAARVRLVRDYDPNIGSVDLDPVQMWQVLLNLVRNAREAMTQGGEIRVRTRRSGDELQISVSDTGTGIKEENIPKIFLPFFTTKAQGTGLGLALSQQIVAEHGGRIECRSTPGVGTTFAIFLPCPTRGAPSRRVASNPVKTQPRKLHEMQPAGSH
jgi:signal transduction histidine kinase